MNDSLAIEITHLENELKALTSYLDGLPNSLNGTSAMSAYYRRQAHLTETLRKRQQLQANLSRILSVAPAGSPPEAYWNVFGLADFSSKWSRIVGKGRRICILGSGVNAMHPALRGAVVHAVAFDGHGNQRTPPIVDFAGHGTIVAGTIAGRTVVRAELGVPGYGALRVGLLPDAEIVSVSVFDCGDGDETGTITQVLSGLDWAVGNAAQFAYEIVVIGATLRRNLVEIDDAVDHFISLMWRCGLMPFLSAGDCGNDSPTLGTRGVYVGATDRKGNAWASNGPRLDLLAPGLDLLCCGSPTSPADGLLLQFYSSTSVATAVAASCVLLLAEASGKSCLECLSALYATSGGEKQISLNDALAWLTSDASKLAPKYPEGIAECIVSIDEDLTGKGLERFRDSGERLLIPA